MLVLPWLFCDGQNGLRVWVAGTIVKWQNIPFAVSVCSGGGGSSKSNRNSDSINSETMIQGDASESLSSK